MPTEFDQRNIFAILQVLVGLVAPAILFFAFSGTLTSLYQAAYWLGLPAVSFSILAWLSVSRRGDQFRVSRAGIEGAAIAGYLALVVPAIFLWFTTGANYRGGGANIGVAALVVAMPVYLPLVMSIGFAVGESLRGRQKHT